jgi:hypothetical protein
MNVTLAIDDQLIERAREVARVQGLSLNELIRRLLEAAAGDDAPMHAARYRSFPRPREQPEAQRSWSREDAYDGRT